ncbi:MAG: hypothetical protein KVP17_000329 [Porospora cf. gigantea B]|uniref:uncharacterized protein n=1 Tax=Porospora cf. gigantea B TaxID=2853592 RepID=UPI003571EBDD|nr:MAG: hypothetical protein KVP17_000329 [Porospora cf. gigantea B]
MLVLVDMGLPQHMVEKVKRMCNVRYVQFDFEKLNVLCANVDQIHPISWLSATKRRPTRWYTKPIPICGNETPLL